MSGASDTGAQIRRFVCESLTKPLPIYAHAAVHGDTAHISAVQGFIPGTFTFAAEVAAEAEQMLQNLAQILRGIGSGLDKILKMNLFFTNMERDFVAVNEVVNRHIPEHSPARSSIGVAALPRGARVVVDCVVAVDGRPAAAVENYRVELINDLDEAAFAAKFARLSGSRTWTAEMARRRPFASAEAALEAAADVWWNVCSREDRIESFNSRPLIGDQESFAKDKWCLLEDEHVIAASKEVADELVRCNDPYLKKFGYVWILLCEGLTPDQQLAEYKRRITNDRITEYMENSVQDFHVTARRLRLCMLDRDPYDT